MGRFIEVPMSAIEEMVAKVRSGVEGRGGIVRTMTVGREVVYEIVHPRGGIVHFYTSAAVGQSILRSIGTDAVRVTIGVRHDGEFRPTHKSKKILRTAPQGIPDDERIRKFIERCTQMLRDAYAASGRGTVTCPGCGSHMTHRKTKSGSEFLGCITFPKCRVTRPY